MNLLHIDSSIFGDNSVSRQLSAEIVAAERARRPDLVVTHRDLGATPLQHLTAAHLGAAPDTDAAEGQAALAEFLAADVIVIGAPMYNFGIPSQLKAWIDRVAIAGKTFRYTANGPEGLAGGKRVIVASARGGVYSTTLAAMDHQESYLRTVMGFLGITEVSFIRAEGVAMGPEQKARAIEAALGEVRLAA